MTYSKRTWLNNPGSYSTGSVVTFDGVVEWDSGQKHHTYLEIAGCSSKVKLHRADYDTEEDFINKMKLLRQDIDQFINHLKNNHEKNTSRFNRINQ